MRVSAPISDEQSAGTGRLKACPTKARNPLDLDFIS
jgi:hypothetical protein